MLILQEFLQVFDTISCSILLDQLYRLRDGDTELELFHGCHFQKAGLGRLQVLDPGAVILPGPSVLHVT